MVAATLVLIVVALFVYRELAREDTMSLTDREHTRVAIPALDATAPPVTETATFAMG
jgi:hypothetical protein